MTHLRRVGLGLVGLLAVFALLALIGLLVRFSPWLLIALLVTLVAYPIGIVIQEEWRSRHG